MLDTVALSSWISATQVDTYRLCPRKWGWKMLNWIKTPPNKYAERGNRLHRVAERWLEKGTPADVDTEEGKIFIPGIKFLPPPGTGLTERQFTFATDTAIYIGLWDLFIPLVARDLQDYILYQQLPSVPVYDHKSTTDFKWMKKAEELCKDPQAVIYAVAAGAGIHQRWGAVPRVCLNWIYYRANANKPGARRVQLYVLPEGDFAPPKPSDVPDAYFGALHYPELMETFAGIEATAAELLEHRRQRHKAMDLEYNVEGCNAFGGCPYRDNPCKLSFSETIRGHMAQKDNIVERARAAQAAASTGKPQTGAAAATGQSEIPGLDLAARIEASKTVGTTSEASPEAVADAQAVLAKTAAETQGGPPEINPPGEAQATPPSEEQAPAASAAEPGKQPNSALERMSARMISAERLAGTFAIAGGLAAARLYNHTSPSYAEDVGNLALEVADAIIAASQK